jgi:hypothetical protein
MPPRLPPARKPRHDHRHTCKPAEHEHRPQRQRAERRTDDDQHRQDQSPRRADRAEDAPGRPVAVARAPERAREERDPRRIADSRRQRRVHERADAVAGDRAHPVDPSAAELDRGAPDPGVAQERAEEPGSCRPEPDRPRVLEPAEGAPHVRAEELRRRGDGQQHDADDPGGNQRPPPARNRGDPHVPH